VSGLFDLVVPAERANRRFLDLRDGHAFTAARRLMSEVFADFRDVDRSFVREFQTGGFSPRVFELALFAALREQNLVLDRDQATVDFVVRGEHPVAIEATTTNPAAGMDPDDVDPRTGPERLVPDDLDAAEREFVHQAGKALRRKLVKRDSQGRAYWELPHVAGVPFVIALEAFHGASSLFHAVSPLATYLLGRRDAAAFDDDGTLRLSAEQVSEHEYNGKVIPSGLFALPEAAHLAAVVFSNSATVSKFNRMGTELGYGPDDVAMIRIGAAPDPDPNATLPIPFAYVVGDYGPEEREEFSEGWHVIHNPRATLRIDPQALPGFTHHQLQDNGLVLTTSTRPDPFASQTRILEGPQALHRARTLLAQTTKQALTPGE
jgi:hypothetical protein